MGGDEGFPDSGQVRPFRASEDGGGEASPIGVENDQAVDPGHIALSRRRSP